jgi:hypothetical protein
MIFRHTIGNHFRGVVDYLHTGRLDAPSDKQPFILFAEGVSTDSPQAMSADFQLGCTLNTSLTNPVWHCVISFNPDDNAKLTNEKMLAVAQDFRKEMEMLNTQCVIIRHFDQDDNQHLHILINRVADDGHSIPDARNFYRSKKAGVKLCEDHGLTPAAGQRPELQHPDRIVGAYDKAGAQIRQALAYGLQTACDRPTLWRKLEEKAITTNVSSRGVSFIKDGFAFKGSEVARGYSLSGIDKQLAVNQLAQARQDEQQGEEQAAQARENEQIRRRGQQMLTELVDQKAFASHAELTGQVAERGYVFVTSLEREGKLRHEASGQEFVLAEVQPGGPTARPFWEQAEAVIQLRAEEVQAQAERREQARRETVQALTQTRDAGLLRPEEFFERMRTQPYDLRHDPQTQELTHVRHRQSGEEFAWAEVQPGGPGAPPLAQQLATAVRFEELRAAERERVRGLEQVEGVVTRVRGEQNYFSHVELQACLQAEGVSLLPPTAEGRNYQFVLQATGQRYYEKDVLPAGSSVVEILAEAEVRRLARRAEAEAQTKYDVQDLLSGPAAQLKSVGDYEQQINARGYNLIVKPGQETEIIHLASSERFALAQVQPGGPAATALLEQVKQVVAQQKQEHKMQVQATEVFEQVLAAKNFTSPPEFQTRIRAQGYEFIHGIDGSERLLHEASRCHIPLAKVRPHGRDWETQVTESIASRQLAPVSGQMEVLPAPAAKQPVIQVEERVQGQIEVLAGLRGSAVERAAHMQTALVAAGALAEVTLRPAAGAAEKVVLNYSHAVQGAPPLDELNVVLGNIQVSGYVTVRERNPGTGHPAAAWPERSGEYAQATLLFDSPAAQRAAAAEGPVIERLQQAGAIVRQVSGSPAGELVLEVNYHTQRADVGTLTSLLDKWQEQYPPVEVRETDRAREARGGQPRAKEKGHEYGA